MKFTPIYLPKSPEGLSGGHQKRMNNNLPLETSHSYQEKALPPLTLEKITNDMQQKKSQLDVAQSEIKQGPADLQQRQSCDARNDVSRSHEQEITFLPCKNEYVSDILMQKNPSPNLCNPDEQNLAYSSRPEKAVEKLQPRRNPGTGYCSSEPDQVIIPMNLSEKLSTIPKEEPIQFLDARNHALVSTEDNHTYMEREKVSADLVSLSSSSMRVPVTQSDRENFSYSSKFEKVEKLQPRRNPEPVVAESTPSRALEKGLDDGYNWRKYGQKLVKGNTFIRSYYKCTYLNCQAKRQVEKSHDGSKTDVNLFGNHHHPKTQNSPQVNSTFQVRILDTLVVSASKSDAEPIIDHGGENQHMAPAETLLLQPTVARSADSVTGEVSCLNNDNNDKVAKRLKREITYADDTVVSKPISDLRHVVQTVSEVDLVNDGYRWRKYGQKLVKGNPNPRSYYRCSYAGCLVKKHVERASHDPKLVITTYEGQHDHDMPLSGTVSQSTSTSHANNTMITNGESRSNPEENKNKPVAVDMVVHVSSN